MLARYLTLAICLVLAGCASTGTANFASSTTPGAATVKARWHRESLAVWEGFSFVSIDGKFVSTGLFADPATAVLKVDPGRRSFVIHIKFNRGFGTGPYEALVEMVATLQPHANYLLNGSVTGAQVEVWLEDEATRKRISEPALAQWGKSPPPPMFIPIFIPAR